jgi:hypothetical protein
MLLLLSLAVLAPLTHAAADRPTVLIVIGAEGEPEFGRAFTQSADRWAAAAKQTGAALLQVGRDPASESPADKDKLKSLLAAESKTESHPLWLVLIGHGTYDRREAKFNLRGPDLSDQELNEWLRPLRRPIAVINCASASAPFLTRLSAPNRVVVSATQSGGEIHFTRFGDHLSAAIADPAADLDKDGQTSLLEAFLAASHRVAEFYKQEGRLATEHALLDDNGDARGTPADWFQGTRVAKASKDNTPPDGPRAHQWHLLPTAAERALPPDRRAKRDHLELQIESLRARKPTLPEPDYYAQLELLLLDLARVYQSAPATTTTTTAPSPAPARPAAAP